MQAIQYENKSKMFHRPGTLWLTYYEFRCGYVQRIESTSCTINTGVSLSMWMEHEAFHVRAHNFGKHERVFWDVFHNMTEANRRFFRAKRELGL